MNFSKIEINNGIQCKMKIEIVYAAHADTQIHTLVHDRLAWHIIFNAKGAMCARLCVC